MVDFTQPVQTRDGRPAEVLTTKARGDYPVLYYIGDSGSMFACRINGQHSKDWKSGWDLINVPEELVYWVRINSPFGVSVWDKSFDRPEGATHRITICGDDCRIEKL